MPSVDQALSRLGQIEEPFDAQSFDAAVLAGVEARRREAAMWSRAMGVVAVLALSLGVIAGSSLTSTPAQAQPLAAFAPNHPLSPSALLDFQR